jgi:hypothetical protein
VKLLDAQLEALYDRLRPPKKLLELIKVEMHEIARRRQRIAQREAKGLKRTIDDLENKELKLLDEMLSGRVPKDACQKMSKRYIGRKREAEARLSQLEVDYRDPLDFLDKCIVVASMLSYLHHRFKYEQRKDLLRAVFERIHVKDKAIVGVTLNPPFSFLLGKGLEKVFKDHPLKGATADPFRAF